jgi:hypothetical protein
MPYRLLYIGLALVAVAAIAFGIAFNRSGDAVVLPSQLEAISPQPGVSMGALADEPDHHRVVTR